MQVALTGATPSDPYRNYPGGAPLPYTGQYIVGSNVKTIPPSYVWPFTYQMNFSIQRQVTNSVSVTGAYVGSLGRDLPFLVDRNYPIATPSATNAAANVLSRRPIPILGTVQDLQAIATSPYHSLQLSATHRLSRGFTLTANYVFSKALTSAGIQNTTIPPKITTT